jgi:vacuolar-type H+-ATPase subunit E/Vma4
MKEWDQITKKARQQKQRMKRKDIEKIRERAVSALCNYPVNSAYVNIRAEDLEAVCNALLEKMPEPQMEMTFLNV